MMAETYGDGRVTVSVGEDGVAQVRLVRPEKLNAIDMLMFEALAEAGERLSSLKGVRAVVMAGEGRCFCAGLDVANFGAWAGPNTPDITARTHGSANLYQQSAMVWRHLPVPVIAAIHGVCFGGGLQIASAADIRVVAPDARLSIMEMQWGIVPDMGGFALWRGLVRDDILRELILTARELTGEEAQQAGLATFVDLAPLARAKEIAATIAGYNPHAIRSAKHLLNHMHEADLPAILEAESVAQQKLAESPNQIEAVMSRMEGRKPVFDEF